MTWKPPDEMTPDERAQYEGAVTVCAWLTVIFFAWIATYHWSDVVAVVTGPRMISIGVLTVAALFLRRR
jgi:hypothetical protein